MPQQGNVEGQPREVEVKLDLDPGDVAALRARLSAVTGSAGTAERLVSVYHDTRKKVLRAHGLTLRVRSAGRDRVQTVKRQKSGGAGLWDRAEWETPIESDEPDRDALARTPAAAILRHKTLRPVFATAVDRTTWTVEKPRSLVEVALDEGHIAAGPRVEPLVELELELKRGEAADLFAMVHDLADLGSLRLGVRAKAERGYALADGLGPEVFKAEPIPLTPDMTATAALQAILQSCLRQIRQNELLLVATRRPEALHQARVGLRRLRSALSLFKPLADDEVVAGLRTRLREVSRVFGDARNLDVYLQEGARPAADAGGGNGAFALVHDLERRRREAYDRLIDILVSPAFRILLIDLIAWIETGPWLSDPDPERTALRRKPVGSFAADVLERRWRKLRRKGRHLERLRPHARHRVRIAAKKLRYAAGFFAGLAKGHKSAGRHEAFAVAMEDLQADLGDLNDIQTAHEIAATLVPLSPAGRLPAPFAAAHPSGERDATIGALIEDAMRAHRAIRKQRRFWSKWRD